VNIDNTLLQKYAPTIASALVLILPAVDVLSKNPSPITVLQFLALLITTLTTFSLVAPWKQIIEWAGVIVAAVLPLALTGEITWANWAFVAVAVVKAAATHLGVIIRKDDTAPALATVEASPVIVTSLPADALPKNDALVQGDGLSVDQGGTNTPGQADHKA
jgi:hypothetical protein